MEAKREMREREETAVLNGSDGRTGRRTEINRQFLGSNAPRDRKIKMRNRQNYR